MPNPLNLIYLDVINLGKYLKNAMLAFKIIEDAFRRLTGITISVLSLFFFPFSSIALYPSPTPSAIAVIPDS